MIKQLLNHFLLVIIVMAIPFRGVCQSVYPKWVNDIGGSGDSKATGMITDKQNNIYVSGYFSGTVDFDPSPGGIKNLTSAGGYDMYVAKYTTSGTLLWAVAMGGNALDQVNNMTVDNNGNPTVIGQYQSATLQAGSLSFTNSGGDDIIIVHLDTNGNIIWGKSIGGVDTDRGEEVNADENGNLIVTAIFQSTISLDGNTLTAQNGFNALIAKFDISGKLLWYNNLGSSGDNEVYGNVSDNSGNIYISGTYTGTLDFDPNGTHKTLNNGFNTPFVAKYDPLGKLLWVNSITGSFVYNGSVLSIDLNNNIYLTAAFSSSLTFNSNTTLSVTGNQDTFIAKYSSAGSFQFAIDIGGTAASSFPYQIRTDASNNVYVTGYFGGTIDFDPNPNTTANVTYHGQRDFFLCEYDTNGNYIYAFNGGSPNCDLTLGIELAIDNTGAIILGGSFCQTVNFDPSSCSTDNVTAQNGTSDTFVAKYLTGTSPSASAQITSFQIFQQILPAQIDTVNHTVNVIVASGSNIKSLTPVIGTSSNASITPASGATEDFTSPVIYTVNNNCSPVNYSATVFLADSVCTGTSATLKGSAENPAPTAFTWQLLQNKTWVNAPGTYNAADYQTTAINNTADTVAGYKLRRQITVNGSINYDSFYQLYLVPPVTISNNNITAPVPPTACAGSDPGSITGQAPSGIKGSFTYQWQSSADSLSFTNINGATGISFDPGILNTTTYYRRIIISNACFAPAASNIVEIKVSVVLTNNMVTAPAVTTFCGVANIGTITGSTPSGSNGNVHYQWQLSKDSVNYTDLTGDTSRDLPAFGAIGNTVYIRRAVTSVSCSTPTFSNVIKITVYPALSGNSILGPLVSTFCSVANPGTISGSPTSGGSGTYSYQWQTSSDSLTFTTIAGTNTEDYDPGQVVKTAYFRRLVTSGPCDTALVSNVVKFTISNVPANPVPVAASVQICSGYTATLSVTTQPGLTYDWYDSAARTNLLFTGPVYTTNILNATTVFYVDAQNASCNSAGTASIQVVVIPSPGVPAVLNSRVTVCLQTPVTLSVVNPQQGDTYNWYIDAAGGVPVSTGADFTTALIQSSTAYYVDATNANGCVSAARTVDSVIITPPPQVVAQAAATCPGSSAIITAITTDKNATVSWYADATGGTAVYTGLTFNTPPISSAITYYAEAIDNVTGCISPFRFPVTVELIQPLPAPVVTVLTSTISSVTFQWAAVGGATGYQVSIDGGKTYMEPSGGTDSLTTTISGLTFNQTVTIVVRTTGDVDCKTSNNSIPVTGTAINFNDNLIYVANAFTPNGDGKNDIVYVHSENIRSLKFDVFDQWGELLFTSTNVQKGWDGYYKGTKEPVGVYVYFLAATMNDGKQVNKKGTITLLR